MKSCLTQALLVTTLSAFTGCSMAPHYVRPEPPVAPTFLENQTSTSDLSTTNIGWRNFFLEPKLQEHIASALENNRDLRSAALRITEARALYRIQSADSLPSINAAVSGSHSATPADLHPSGKRMVNHSYQAGLNLAAYELDFFGRVGSLNNAALAQYLASTEAQQAAHITLIAEVAKAWLAERAFAEQLSLAQQSLAARERAGQLARQRFEVGASSALDLRANEILVQSARVSVLTLDRQRAQAHNVLALLVGKPLTATPSSTTLSQQTLLSTIPAGLPADLLIRRPDIRAAEQRLQAAHANIGAARAAFFPRIALTASTGTASTQLSGLFESGSHSWSFVPQLVLPIFDAGRNRANLNVAEVRKELAVIDYEKTIQVAFREVADALVARQDIEEQILAQAAVVEANAERLRLSKLRFESGIANSIEVLDAERELFSATQALVQIRLLRLTNAIDLYRALGGGVLEHSNQEAATQISKL